MARNYTIDRRDFLGRALAAGAAGVAGLAAAGRAAGAEKPSGWQIGCYTRLWDKYDWRLALDEIAKAGFKHAGLMTTNPENGKLVISVDTSPEDAQRIGEEVRKRGMEIPSVYGGGIPVQKSLEDGVAGMKRLIDNCAAAGAKSLLMGGIGNEALYDRYYKAIAESCDYAAEKKIPVTVKPHGGLNATGPQCRKCLEMVGHDSFSLWYDPGNIYFYSDGQRDPVEDAATVDGLVRVGMCIKDFAMTEKDGKPAKDVWVTPGTGMVEFPKVMARLKAGGFTGGALVVECVNRPDPDDLPAILAEAKKARQYVEQLVAGL
jgi:sugar phosphate isomerase/epimerase